MGIIRSRVCGCRDDDDAKYGYEKETPKTVSRVIYQTLD